MTQTTSTLTLMNASKRFGDLEAVSDVTVSLRAGEVVGFVGPNGAGKTTTISMLMGFIRPTTGTVTVLGQPILPETAHKVHKNIGYVAGDMVLPGSLTGQDFLAFTAARNGRDLTHYEQLVATLNPVLNKPLRLLSRGNKQKIALIAALQHAPEVLILDEPTSGLDPLMQDIFLATLKNEAKRGATVFMSSHILSEISSICDRAIFMRSGKFILDKPLSAITAQLGKHVTITTQDVKKLIQFLPEGVSVVSQSGQTLTLSAQPDNLKPLLRWLVTKKFDDLTIENRDLDDIFHELYKGTSRKPA